MPDDQPYRFKRARNAEPSGLTCPKCGCADLRVKVTWHSGDSVKRRRVCRRCGEAFPTAEVRL